MRALLGEDAFAAAFAAGRTLPLDHAIAEAFAVTEAMGVATGRRGAAQDSAIPDLETAFGLTRREFDVLRLLARRATDREIADALSISPRTVMHHVSRILAKLNVANRRDAAAWASQHRIA